MIYLLKKHYSFVLIVSITFLSSVCSNSFKRLKEEYKEQQLKSIKFDKNGKVGIKISHLNMYLAENCRFEPEEYRNWTLFQSLDGGNLLMFGIYTKPNHYEFLSYNDTTLQLTLSKSQTVDSQKHQKHWKVFQLVYDKLKHFVTDKYLCFEDELCKHWRDGNDVEIEYTFDFL